ncbi:hypothetical protein EYF80_009603 [Liparis tanakae]|uniref:Uncharacterized protein n=1 Tax=Liparis tanakae TaxID=230148 RepID=A0A4Z2IRN6_9TELE|nr:hypothetical protein EYF80_009603 [Liparis tanakae]
MFDSVDVVVVTWMADEDECLAMRVKICRTSWTTRGDGRNTSRIILLFFLFLLSGRQQREGGEAAKPREGKSLIHSSFSGSSLSMWQWLLLLSFHLYFSGFLRRHSGTRGDRLSAHILKRKTLLAAFAPGWFGCGGGGRDTLGFARSNKVH